MKVLFLLLLCLNLVQPKLNTINFVLSELEEEKPDLKKEINDLLNSFESKFKLHEQLENFFDLNLGKKLMLTIRLMELTTSLAKDEEVNELCAVALPGFQVATSAARLEPKIIEEKENQAALLETLRSLVSLRSVLSNDFKSLLNAVKEIVDKSFNFYDSNYELEKKEIMNLENKCISLISRLNKDTSELDLKGKQISLQKAKYESATKDTVDEFKDLLGQIDALIISGYMLKMLNVDDNIRNKYAKDILLKKQKLIEEKIDHDDKYGVPKNDQIGEIERNQSLIKSRFKSKELRSKFDSERLNLNNVISFKKDLGLSEKQAKEKLESVGDKLESFGLLLPDLRQAEVWTSFDVYEHFFDYPTEVKNVPEIIEKAKLLMEERKKLVAKKLSDNENEESLSENKKMEEEKKNSNKYIWLAPFGFVALVIIGAVVWNKYKRNNQAQQNRYVAY